MTHPILKRAALLLAITLPLAIGLLGWIGHGRRQTYLMMAEHHLAEMAAFESASRSDGHVADMYEGKAPREPYMVFLMPVDDTGPLRASEASYARRAAHHAGLSRRYREAAVRPWISLEPDPPSP